MTTFLLLPGAGGAAWYWHRVTPLLEAAGHRAVALQFPSADPAKGLRAYGDLAELICTEGLSVWAAWLAWAADMHSMALAART